MERTIEINDNREQEQGEVQVEDMNTGNRSRMHT